MDNFVIGNVSADRIYAHIQQLEGVRNPVTNLEALERAGERLSLSVANAKTHRPAGGRPARVTESVGDPHGSSSRGELLTMFTLLALAVLVITVVPVGLATFWLGFVRGDSPCVMCWEQRIGMLLLALTGLFILRFGPRPRSSHQKLVSAASSKAVSRTSSCTRRAR